MIHDDSLIHVILGAAASSPNIIKPYRISLRIIVPFFNPIGVTISCHNFDQTNKQNFEACQPAPMVYTNNKHIRDQRITGSPHLRHGLRHCQARATEILTPWIRASLMILLDLFEALKSEVPKLLRDNLRKAILLDNWTILMICFICILCRVNFTFSQVSPSEAFRERGVFTVPSSHWRSTSVTCVWSWRSSCYVNSFTRFFFTFFNQYLDAVALLFNFVAEIEVQVPELDGFPNLKLFKIG